MHAVCAALFITACAPPTLQEESRGEVILVQSWLEHDAEAGQLIGVSSSEERITRTDVRKKVLEYAVSENAPDAIQICEVESTEGTAGTDCELVFFTEDWTKSAPLRNPGPDPNDI